MVYVRDQERRIYLIWRLANHSESEHRDNRNIGHHHTMLHTFDISQRTITFEPINRTKLRHNKQNGNRATMGISREELGRT